VPSFATAELTWGLFLAAMRQIPQQMQALRAGHWQAASRGSAGKAFGVFGYGGSAPSSRLCAASDAGAGMGERELAPPRAR